MTPENTSPDSATALGKTQERFLDRSVTLDNGSAGKNLEIPTRSPLNYYQAISQTNEMASVVVDGKLFLPSGAKEEGAKEGVAKKRVPCIIVASGSYGVTDGALAHAKTLTDAGYAAFVLDSFGARDVWDTISNQTQFSFAASAYDILATWKVLADQPEIDSARIGAQGHSRGGSAVLTAATSRFARSVLSEGEELHSVLAAYPWCGHQFLDPKVGKTNIHVLMGDADEWCNAMQAQGHAQAIRLTGGQVTIKLIGGAHHGFDRAMDVVEIPGGKVTPAAPVAYIADNGAFQHPLEDQPNPELMDRDLMVYSLKAGYHRPNPRIGAQTGQPEIFREDMLKFWKRTLQ